MRKANVTPEESIRVNLNTWCFEVGTEFEHHAKLAAKQFLNYIGDGPVVDLGAGDGAATNVFVKHGNDTTAVDINAEKLSKIKGAKTVNEDFITYLNKPIDNVFLHHSLEHCPNPEEVLSLIGKHLKKDRYCYIAVPKDDAPESCHHTAFDSPEELIPPSLTVVTTEVRERPRKEYIVITGRI